jgi:hypothetical protein
MVNCLNLLRGTVIETNAGSYTGYVLYSDYIDSGPSGKYHQDTCLNQAAQIPFIGIAAGVCRMALSVIHIIGHLIAAAITRNNGHFYHALKGACEMIRGGIESLPGVGRIFAWAYNFPSLGDFYPTEEPTIVSSWWMIKIYQPNNRDSLDKHNKCWVNDPRLIKV